MNYKRPIFIAELCCNHMGSVDLAKLMIDLAKKSGVDIVKFQILSITFPDILFLFSICNLEMLNFCESFTTLSFSQESPDKMPPDPHCSSDLPVSHHLSTGSVGYNSLPSADHV
mgnify:CR=1 FL=1